MNNILAILIATFLTTACLAQSNKYKVGQVWKTDTNNTNLPLKEFLALLPRDGIPPIYKPAYWTQKEAEGTFFAHEPVISLRIGEDSRAYPLSILMFHEIVNDEVGGIPVAVTYCPLCNAAIVYDRRLTYQGKDYKLTLGVSGMLRKSDMVMWDHETETWWQQITGEGLVGELNGALLNVFPSMVISYEEYFMTFPAGKVLSTNTGIELEEDEHYGMNPYENYDDLGEGKPYRFFKDKVDARQPAMERLITINAKGHDIAYPLTIIQSKKVINAKPYGVPVLILYKSGTVSVMDKKEISESKDIGAVTVFSPEVKGKRLKFHAAKDGFRDDKSNSLWSLTGKCLDGKYKGEVLEPIVHGNHFAFAWLAFRPDCEIYQVHD